MGNKEDLKNKLAKTAEQRAVTETPAKPADSIASFLKSMAPEIERALPRHMNADKLLRVTLTTIRLNPKLLECNKASLVAGVMQAAQLGLEPGMLGQCYLIPFKNNRLQTTEAQFQIGYKGLIELVRRTGEVAILEAHEVCENDKFEFEYGINNTLKHVPCIKGERGEAYCYYAFAKMKDGSYSFVVMSKQDINKIRDKYSKTKNFGPWVEEYDAMAKKTVLKQLIKYLPLSVEVMRNVAQDETVKTELDPNMNDVLDITAMASEHLENDNVVEAEYTEASHDGETAEQQTIG